MKEKEINSIVRKFSRVMGPVAERIAVDVAKELGIRKGDKISPSNAEDYEKFLGRLGESYAKIIGTEVVKTIMKL